MQYAQAQFADQIFNQTVTALTHLPQTVCHDIYALSFLIDGSTGYLPTLMVSYNTNTQYNSQIANTFNQDDEAKWNIAYWLLDDAKLCSAGLDDNENTVLLNNWLAGAPFAYTEEQYDDYDDSTLGDKPEQFYRAFVETIIGVVQRLFAENKINETFGRNIPVLVHELEYYDEPLSWTKQANPQGVADEFLAYWNGQM